MLRLVSLRQLPVYNVQNLARDTTCAPCLSYHFTVKCGLSFRCCAPGARCTIPACRVYGASSCQRQLLTTAAMIKQAAIAGKGKWAYRTQHSSTLINPHDNKASVLGPGSATMQTDWYFTVTLEPQVICQYATYQQSAPGEAG